jgi:hypothetical protein
MVVSAVLLFSACAHRPPQPPEVAFDATAVDDLLGWARSEQPELPTVWRGTRAYQLARAWARWSGQPDPDLAVIEVLAQIGAEKINRGSGRPLDRVERFLAEIDASHGLFMAHATPLIAAYLPADTPIRARVLFAAFIPPYAFAWGDGSIVVNITAGHFSYQPDRVYDLLVHEVFHAGFGVHQRGRSPLSATSPSDLIECVLWQTQSEGLATYVAYRARPPGLFVEDYALIEDRVAVGETFAHVNQLIADAAQAQDQDLTVLKQRVFALGAQKRAFYVIGAVMAQHIEQVLGRRALVDTVRDGPDAFFAAYARSNPPWPLDLGR